jgi:hypothetical protein
MDVEIHKATAAFSVGAHVRTSIRRYTDRSYMGNVLTLGAKQPGSFWVPATLQLSGLAHQQSPCCCNVDLAYDTPFLVEHSGPTLHAFSVLS